MPEIEHLKRKIGEGDFELLREVLNRNADAFSRHKADIGCCSFVEREIELEEGTVPQREDARRMTPHKSEAWRAAEIEMLLEYDMIEPSKSPVLGMPTENRMYVLDTDASVVAISGILHQEQEWKGRTVLRPIAYGSKVLSDTELKYGAPKAEMFAVVTFVEKYRAYLGSAPFRLKTYSMDQSYIGRWIVRLDGYHMIIEHRMRDKHQNADSLSKKTEFYERMKQKQANQAEINEGFSFLDEETYETLPLTRWLESLDIQFQRILSYLSRKQPR